MASSLLTQIVPLWKTIVSQLPPRDPETEWYSLRELAPLLGIQTRALGKHARDLWPLHEGHYRLNREQAERLIRRVCWAGKKVPRVLADGGETSQKS